MLRVAATFAMMGASLWAQSGPLELEGLTPPSGSGEAQVFRLAVSDGNGGRDVASVGLYVGERFDAAQPGGACVVWLDVAAGRARQIDDTQCKVTTAAWDGTGATFTVTFAAGFAGSKRVWGYASAAGDTRSTGWKEVGSWLVTARAGQMEAYPATDPDGATRELDRAETERDKLLRENAGAAELAHGKGVLRFGLANGRKVAIVGSVTHQEPVTGQWVANAPVLSETNQGWRVDGTSNRLVIRKKGLNQHTVTQTFTDFASKHDSTLTLTVPSLVYDKKEAFHFAQDGLTWDLTVDGTGAFNLAAKVGAKQGRKAYTFGVESSEGLAVDAKGNLIGDVNVKLSRAMMYPKNGNAVACSAWTYSAKDGASFTCDDSGFTAAQIPYLIDPSSHTYTDTGTYTVASWYDFYGPGDTHGLVPFNTSGLIPSGGFLISESCGYTVTEEGHEFDGYQVRCEAPTFNNSGTTTVTVAMNAPDCDQCYYNRWATVTNVTLTVTYANAVTVTVSPSTRTLAADPSQVCGYYSQFGATVDAPAGQSTAVTWSTGGVGTACTNGAGANQVFYVPPAAVDGTTAVTLTARSVYDTSKTGTATITVTPLAMSVTLAPGSASLQEGQTRQFTATVVNRVTQTCTWALTPAVGSISSSGLYTAPAVIAAGQTVTVKATSVLDGTKYATATVTLVAGVWVTVGPAAVSLTAAQTQQFTATVTGTGNTAVTWSVSPAVGTVSGSGLYTAPTPVNSQQIVTVTATSVANPSRSATAAVTVIPIAVSVSSGAAMYPSQIQQFTATVTNSPNGAVTWSVSPAGRGGINSGGLYTSPAVVASTQTVTILATSVADPTKTGSTVVTLQPGSGYGYYVTDNLAAPNGSLWTNVGGTQLSTVVVPDLSANYEVRAVVHGNTTLYARAAAAGGALSSYYALAMTVSGAAANFTLSKLSGGVWTTLAAFPGGYTDGMTVRLAVKGSEILVWPGTAFFGSFTDTGLTTGQPAALGSNATVSLGAVDGVAPGTVSGVQWLAAPHEVDLQWTAAADDGVGVGIGGYRVYRHGGGLLGTVTGTQFTDESAQPGANVAYDIVAFDQHDNAGAAVVTANISVPSSSAADGRRVGVRPTGAYWGGAGEQIDVESGNLNFTVALLKAQSRGGWGASFALSYNSQMWRKDAAGHVWKLGGDVGYGLGWKLQAGSVRPVWNDTGSVSHYVYGDATGAEYRLEVNTGGLWTSQEGVYAAYEPGTGKLWFPDGGFWVMGSMSGSTEADAGTLYPTLMQDTNGDGLS